MLKMAKGIDCTYHFTEDKARELKSQGYDFVCRYLAPDTSQWKKLTRDEAVNISKAGLNIISVWETCEDRALGGAQAGKEDGQAALAEAIKVGQPKGSTIYFAVDFDANSSQFDAIEAYLRAASNEITGYNVGVYGSYVVVEEMAKRNACKYFWQTYAWSGGKKSQHMNVYQYKNGANVLDISCDLDESFGNEGWWSIQVKESAKMGQVIKERIYASGTPWAGKLEYVDLTRKDAYSVPATDVRYIKLDHTKTKFKLVWEQGAKVSDLVKKYGADYGINAPFFWQGNPVADCIVDGKILNRGYDKQTTWHGAAYKDGKLQLGYFDINGGWDFLIKTTPYLISNGNPCWDYYRVQEGTATDIGKDDAGNYVRAQRTFIGVDANGDIIIAASDGRTKSDQGLTLQEMALFMADKGAVNALNFDGGSSTVIADQTGMLNAQPGGEKAVNHALLIFIDKEQPVPTPTPAQVTVDVSGNVTITGNLTVSTVPDWKQAGFDYLVQNYGLDATQHKPTDVVDLGTLGELLKRKDGK
jgi:hypothetical protein